MGSTGPRGHLGDPEDSNWPFFFFCYHDRKADADDVDEDATVTTREQQRVYRNITR